MDANQIVDEARALLPRIAEFRRHIHRHPELSFREEQTARFIMQTLSGEGLECVPVARTGVLVKIEGRGPLADALVLRADIDALPITETTGLPYCSGYDGVMHACGHDMHTAALMGALLMLNRHRDEISGTVFGLFQPGEELLPGGASMVLAEDPLAGYRVRAFYGEHVDPDLPTGVFGFRAGEYMASTDELHIAVVGVGGHGAMRHRVKDPVEAAANLITRLLQLGNSTDGQSVLSIGRVMADGATNVIPDRVEIQGTMRTFDETLRASLKGRVGEISQEVSSAFGVAVEADIREGYPAVVNDSALAENAARLFAGVFGADSVVRLDRRMTGEDFGYYTRRYPSLFYRFGVGGPELSRTERDGGQPAFGFPADVGKLHTPVFSPDEKALEYAAAGLALLAFDNRRP